MKFLLETVFSLVFFAIFIWALPAIIGIFALGLILYFVFSPATGSFGGSAGKEQETTYRNYRTDDGRDENNSRTDAQYETKTRTAEQTTHYTNSCRSGYRHYESDNYDSCNSSYYDDWGNDDTPPDDEIHFRGTGAPFL